MKEYFYKLIYNYLSLYVFDNDSVLFVNPVNTGIFKFFKKKKYIFLNEKQSSETEFEDFQYHQNNGFDYDYIIINGTLHFERSISNFLKKLRHLCSNNTRVIITYYNSLWRPLIKLSTLLGIRAKHEIENWISPEDITNFLLLSDFEEIQSESRILMPVHIPLLTSFINSFVSTLPLFRFFHLINISISRKSPELPLFPDQPSVSVVVPARNEEKNISDIIRRLPKMGPDDELIFIEGNSHDNTWSEIIKVAEENSGKLDIITAQQDGIGKGDAVRKGFSIATKEILMILDADLTVPPEVLPEFYDAIVNGKGEFINGSRLVYPMEKKAMRYFNILGNRFFAIAFSYVLRQKLKDTLCGTKVLSLENYKKLKTHRSYFGNIDPFGDFDLIFGSARLALKIVEIPVRYHDRKYGDTNISRWKHGAILLRMLIYAYMKFRYR
jgi:hypothetical protein